MRPSRALAGLIALLAVLLAGCTSGDGSKGVAIPDSPVGKKLQWYLEAVNRTPIAESELKDHISQDFLKEVPPQKVNELAQSLAKLTVDKLSSTKPTELTGLTSIPSGQKYDTKISVGTDGKIDYLLFEPIPV
ncbi:Cpe/LpqF family protein [Nonomuraea longicatena]|uniref:ORF 12 gene product N-terminal domain-containing protein n=1 Tax=Nonomuraea longicatena TaxID=83682 RepID=A0ABN1PBT8_9ACTN